MPKYTQYNQWTYAVYKGQDFITEGTKLEICKELGIKKTTFQHYRSNWYKIHRETKKNNRIIIIRLDGKDKIYG